jgi:hypothetical protein
MGITIGVLHQLALPQTTISVLANRTGQHTNLTGHAGGFCALDHYLWSGYITRYPLKSRKWLLFVLYADIRQKHKSLE